MKELYIGLAPGRQVFMKRIWSQEYFCTECPPSKLVQHPHFQIHVSLLGRLNSKFECGTQVLRVPHKFANGIIGLMGLGFHLHRYQVSVMTCIILEEGEIVILEAFARLWQEKNPFYRWQPTLRSSQKFNGSPVEARKYNGESLSKRACPTAHGYYLYFEIVGSTEVRNGEV